MDAISHSQVAPWQGIHLPMQKTRIQSHGREDPLEEETATHFSTLAWSIPWRGVWGVTVHGAAKQQTQLSHWAMSGWLPDPGFFH